MPLRDHPCRHACTPRLFLNIADLLLELQRLFLHAIELGERLLPIIGDLSPLCRIVAVHEVGRERVDPALQRVLKHLRALEARAGVINPLSPGGFALRGGWSGWGRWGG